MTHDILVLKQNLLTLQSSPTELLQIKAKYGFSSKNFFTKFVTANNEKIKINIKIC